MNKLLKKNQIIQFLILLCFFLINNNSEINENNIIRKDSEIYKFYSKIVMYNKLTKKYMKYIKKNIQIPLEYNDNILDKNEYFYLFYNKHNIYVYFFKEVGKDVHEIYFNGMNNKKDIEILLGTILRVVSNKFDFEHVKNIIEKNGTLFEFLPNEINKLNFMEDNILKKNNLITSFDYIYKKYMLNECNDKINLKINGYSLGGIFSQVFVYLLTEKYNNLYQNIFNIDFYNIESWFIGDEVKFKQFIENTNFKNIFNKKSIFSYYNSIFQSYINNVQYLESSKDNSLLEDFVEDNLYVFPLGLISYANKHHFLSKIFA